MGTAPTMYVVPPPADWLDVLGRMPPGRITYVPHPDPLPFVVRHPHWTMVIIAGIFWAGFAIGYAMGVL